MPTLFISLYSLGPQSGWKLDPAETDRLRAFGNCFGKRDSAEGVGGKNKHVVADAPFVYVVVLRCTVVLFFGGALERCGGGVRQWY